jgi:hypothetical protein
MNGLIETRSCSYMWLPQVNQLSRMVALFAPAYVIISQWLVFSSPAPTVAQQASYQNDIVTISVCSPSCFGTPTIGPINISVSVGCTTACSSWGSPTDFVFQSSILGSSTVVRSCRLQSCSSSSGIALINLHSDSLCSGSGYIGQLQFTTQSANELGSRCASVSAAGHASTTKPYLVSDSYCNSAVSTGQEILTVSVRCRWLLNIL